MGRRPRSLLDKRPDLSLKVGNRQAKQKLSQLAFLQLEKLSLQRTSQSPKWLPGSVAEVTGPLSYIIQLQDGTTRRRHVDNIRS